MQGVRLAIAKTGSSKSYLFILAFLVIIFILISTMVCIICGCRILALAFIWRCGLHRAHRTVLWRHATVTVRIGAHTRKDATRRGSGTYAALLGACNPWRLTRRNLWKSLIIASPTSSSTFASLRASGLVGVHTYKESIS